MCFSTTRFSGTQQKSMISCWVMVLIIHCSPALTRVGAGVQRINRKQIRKDYDCEIIYTGDN